MSKDKTIGINQNPIQTTINKTKNKLGTMFGFDDELPYEEFIKEDKERIRDRVWSMKSWQADPSGQPNQWQKERGYDPSAMNQNPKARFHANGKYATGIYKKWLEENQ